MISVSIVSHGHGSMVADLLRDLATMPQIARVVLTLNVSEILPPVPAALVDKLLVIENKVPKGFAANHNAAFLHCETPFFCVLNPDVRMPVNPFDTLKSVLEAGNTALVAPLVVNSSGAIEDSARLFPTPLRLLRKMFSGGKDNYPVMPDTSTLGVDWVAGMCMLFRSDAYQALGGFDEKYFLYYEDVDVCARAWKQGWKVALCPAVSVVHDAQRASHRKLKFLRWHVASMMRFFYVHYGRLPLSEKV